QYADKILQTMLLHQCIEAKMSRVKGSLYPHEDDFKRRGPRAGIDYPIRESTFRVFEAGRRRLGALASSQRSVPSRAGRSTGRATRCPAIRGGGIVSA